MYGLLPVDQNKTATHHLFISVLFFFLLSIAKENVGKTMVILPLMHAPDIGLH